MRLIKMSREKPKNIYRSKVTKFGNGAKIKGYKKHIGQDVIIMVKEEKWTEKDDKEMDKLESDIADRWIKKGLY